MTEPNAYGEIVDVLEKLDWRPEKSEKIADARVVLVMVETLTVVILGLKVVRLENVGVIASAVLLSVAFDEDDVVLSAGETVVTFDSEVAAVVGTDEFTE